MQRYYTSRRSHEKACAGGSDFWEVVSTLTQDLTKARNQLARLIKQVKPGGARLFSGNCGRRRPLLPIHHGYTPPCTQAGSNLPPNCHRTSPPGHFMCGKQYPHYKSPSPDRRRPGSCRPVSVFGANPFGRRQPRPCSPQRALRFNSEEPKKRPQWSFEQPQPERAQYSCREKSQRPVTISCERQDKCETNSNSIKICINPRSRRRCRRKDTFNTCNDCSGPARLQGGKRPVCLGTQFANLLEEVTCQLRERRLNAAVDEEVLSSRSCCS